MYTFTVNKYMGLLSTPSLSKSTEVCYVHIQCFGTLLISNLLTKQFMLSLPTFFVVILLSISL